eukprot:CAMPEP_0176482726 /NCGR_PEP_ID=MMETSP0200_2-20121128/3531_1 /TAXON_ID=947934 /ORGANISM="Chaetoceros sp., Strain GSL56" /LENGTH=656 /DNA_ID=CAMNT_0017879065 /DNA_START=91 /DNA_END=2061 /DNA_ORIENTATION=+
MMSELLFLSFSSLLIINSQFVTFKLKASAITTKTNSCAFAQTPFIRSIRSNVICSRGFKSQNIKRVIHRRRSMHEDVPWLRNERLWVSASGDYAAHDDGSINIHEIDYQEDPDGEHNYNYMEFTSQSSLSGDIDHDPFQSFIKKQQHADDFLLPSEIDQRTMKPASAKTITGMHIAPASEIAYFYLQDTIGLGPDIMWKISNDAGSVLGFTVKNLEQKISLLTRMMNLSQDDVKEIITKQPSILHMSATRNISPTILFFVRAMDLSKKDLKTIVVAYPCILCYSVHNLANKISFFTKELGLNKEEMRELIISEPRLLCAAVNTGLLPRLQFLHKEMSIPLENLQKILRANPRLLLYSLERNLQPKFISFFIMRLYMQPKDILKLLTYYPLIIDYSLENHMLPIARYFLTELEFSPMEMKHILLKFPRIMTHSLFKIKHLVGYLRYQLGMNAKEVKRVLFQAPQVISLNTDKKVASKVEFLKDTFELTNDKDLRKVISGMPTILLCNTEENIRPKAEYLLKEFGGDRMEMRQAVITLPTLLGYSLEKRIKPRMGQILDGGLQPIKITVGITMTDKKFQGWLDSSKRTGDAKKKHRDWLEGSIGEQYIEKQGLVDVEEIDDTTMRKMSKDVSKDEATEQNLGKPVTSSLDGRIIHWKH